MGDEHIIFPEWDKAGKVHDWRNHVPQNVRNLWDTFTIIQLKALYAWAYNLAMEERWD